MWLRATAIGAGILLIAAVLAYAMMDGARRYAASEERETAMERAETDAICERLGAPRGACAVELDQVRQSREERLARRATGVL